MSEIGGIFVSKKKIKLSKEKETLLIPLYCKAKETSKDNGIIKDNKAKEIISQIEYNFNELNIPHKTCVTLNIRAQKLDKYVNEFIQSNTTPLIIHLGCGLDNRYGRITNQNIDFYDLDFKEVIELKKNFYQETDYYHFIASSVTDYDWMEEVQTEGQVMIVAEGLLMYLKEDKVKELFNKLCTRFKGAHFVFDAYSKYTAKNINKHASIKKTGADIHWGIDNPQEIEKWNQDIKFIEEWSFTDYDQVDKLSAAYKVAFKTAGLFKTAKKAHRILYYKL